MKRSILPSILFWLLAGVAAALAALALVVGGRIPIDPATGPDVTRPEALVHQVTTPPAQAGARVERQSGQRRFDRLLRGAARRFESRPSGRADLRSNSDRDIC